MIRLSPMAESRLYKIAHCNQSVLRRVGQRRDFSRLGTPAWTEAPRYLIRDRDAIYGAAVTRRLRAMGIRDKPIAPGSPWQNSFAERLIGSIRRECVDHVIALGEQHLRRPKSYASYHNSARTHRPLDKDAPVSRPVQRIGRIVSHALVGGLHYQYARI
jgi:Integrase core domain